MTLRDYYQGLPARTSPKTRFVEEVMDACGTKEVTVKNWVNGKSLPANPAHRQILSDITGIPEDELFPKLKKVENR